MAWSGRGYVHSFNPEEENQEKPRKTDSENEKRSRGGSILGNVMSLLSGGHSQGQTKTRSPKQNRQKAKAVTTQPTSNSPGLQKAFDLPDEQTVPASERKHDRQNQYEGWVDTHSDKVMPDRDFSNPNHEVMAPQVAVDPSDTSEVGTHQEETDFFKGKHHKGSGVSRDATRSPQPRKRGKDLTENERQLMEAIDERTMEKSELQEKLSKANQEILHLPDQVRQLVTESEERMTQKRSKEGSGDHQSAEGETDHLKQRVHELESQLAKLKEHSKFQSRKVYKLKEEAVGPEMQEETIQSYEGIIQDLEKREEKLQKDLRSTRSELETMVFENDFADERRDREAAHGIIADLEKKLAHQENLFTEEKAEYHRQLAIAQQYAESARKEFEQAKKEMEKLKFAISKKQRTKEMEDVDFWRGQAATLQHQIQEISNYISDLEQSLSHTTILQKDCQDKDTLIEQLRKEIEKKSKDLDKMTKKVNNLEEEIKKKKKKDSGAEAPQETVDAQKLARTEQPVYNNASVELQELHKELRKWQGRYQQLQNENSELKRQVQAMQVSFKEQDKQIQKIATTPNPSLAIVNHQLQISDIQDHQMLPPDLQIAKAHISNSSSEHNGYLSTPIYRESDINMESVKGARKIWGTLKTTTVSAVLSTLTVLTSISQGDIKVKRKYKKSTDKDKPCLYWWFVVRGSEEVMKQLDDEWGIVLLQTNWKIKPVFKFSDSISQGTTGQQLQSLQVRHFDSDYQQYTSGGPDEATGHIPHSYPIEGPARPWHLDGKVPDTDVEQEDHEYVNQQGIDNDLLEDYIVPQHSEHRLRSPTSERYAGGKPPVPKPRTIAPHASKVPASEFYNLADLQPGGNAALSQQLVQDDHDYVNQEMEDDLLEDNIVPQHSEHWLRSPTSEGYAGGKPPAPTPRTISLHTSSSQIKVPASEVYHPADLQPGGNAALPQQLVQPPEADCTPQLVPSLNTDTDVVQDDHDYVNQEMEDDLLEDNIVPQHSEHWLRSPTSEEYAGGKPPVATPRSHVHVVAQAQDNGSLKVDSMEPSPLPLDSNKLMSDIDDPNCLMCPVPRCNERFRIVEIQNFLRHVDKCRLNNNDCEDNENNLFLYPSNI